MTVTSSIVNALLSAINTAVSDVDSVFSAGFTPANQTGGEYTIFATLRNKIPIHMGDAKRVLTNDKTHSADGV